MWARTLGSWAVVASCACGIAARPVQPVGSGSVQHPLRACRLLSISDARQLLGQREQVAESVPLPAVNGCFYFANPAWVHSHREQSEIIGVSLFVDFPDVNRGKSAVRVGGRVVLWALLPGDRGVMSFKVRSSSLVVFVTGNRSSASALERVAESATRMVLARL